MATAEEKAAARAAADAKKAEEKAAKDAEKAAARAAADASKGDGPIVVRYRDHLGMATERTFSEEVHGKDFAKLAEEFKETNASKIIK